MAEGRLDLDQPDEYDPDLTNDLETPVSRQERLSRKLAHLKRVESDLQRRVDTLGGAPARSVTVDSLLHQNDESVATHLGVGDDQVQDGVVYDEALYAVESEISTAIDPTDLSQLARFHSLKITPVTSSKLIECGIIATEFDCQCLDGATVLMRFSVKLHVQQSQKRVHSISVHKLSPWCRKDLTGFIVNAATDKNIFLLMHGMSQYGYMIRQRHRVFKKLALQYTLHRQSDIIWTNSPQMVIPINSRLKAILSWPIRLNDRGEATSVPTLAIDWRQLSQHPASRLAAKHSAAFRTLVRQKGVYQATLIIMNLLT